MQCFSGYPNSLVDFHTGAVEGGVALIAYDGLYDVFSSKEAVDVVRKGLVENADDPVRAAASVYSAAVDERGSRDNVTAVVSRCGRRSRREYRE